MKLSLILLVIGLGHQNANDPRSYAIGVVFGKKLDRKGEHQGKPRYDVGNSRHGKRDYSVCVRLIW